MFLIILLQELDYFYMFQVIYKYDVNSLEMIISSLFLKISQQGVGADFFNSIITNSKTDLKLPDCYFWTDNMAEVSKNLIFLNNNG